MKATVKKLPEAQIEILFELSLKDFNFFIKKATFNLSSEIEIKGFRKGKVPEEIVERAIDRSQILVEAADLAVKENYKKAVLENNIEAISDPQINILKLAPGNPFVFRVKVSVLPEIKLPDYKKIASEVKRREIKVEEKEIEGALKWFQKSRAKFTLKNGPAQGGDFVEIEYSPSQIKELNQQTTKKDAFILGEGHFFSGFEEKLIGMRAGEEKEEISVVIPKEHRDRDLAGKEIVLRVKMISVQKVEFPEINDQFAKSLGQFENLAGLKKSIKEGLNSEKKQLESQRIRWEILKKINELAECEIPEVLIEKEQKAMMENFKKDVSEKLKISFEDYLSKIKKTEEEILKSFLREAQKRIKNHLILREISKREKIEVSEKEITDEISKILKKYSSVKKGEEKFDLEKLKLYTEEGIRNEKIFNLLEILSL